MQRGAYAQCVLFFNTVLRLWKVAKELRRINRGTDEPEAKLAMKASNANAFLKVSKPSKPVLISLIPSALMAYGYALWHDIEHDMWGHLIADLLFPPFGIIRGASLLFINWPY